MKGKWIKDFCPYAKNQGFYSVVGNVDKGQKVLGFEHTQVGAADAIVFSTATRNVVTQMQDTGYEVILSDTSSGSVVTICYVTDKSKTGFILNGEAAAVYDVVVIGNVNY
jgi:predicted amino acid dehydrogenase